MRPSSLAALLVCWSLSAFADSPRALLTEADMVLERAQDLAEHGFFSGGQCMRRVPDRIEVARDALADAAEDEDAFDDRGYRMQLKTLKRARKKVEQALDTAQSASCPGQVMALLGVAVSRTKRAEDKLEDRRTHNWQDPGLPPGPPPGQGQPRAELAPLAVYENQPFEGVMAVRVDVTRLTLMGLQGRQVGFTVQVKSDTGRMSEVRRSGPVTVPSSPYVWDNAYAQYFKIPDLLRLSLGQGRLSARVAVVDDTGRELTSAETVFSITGGPPPPPQAPPGVPVVARDCGTGPDDSGCLLQKNGKWPMDAETFRGLTQSLRGTPSEFSKKEMVESVLANQVLTAKQLGALFDLFQSEFNRMDLAKLAVPKLTNPSAALGLSVKFDSSFNRSEYVKLVSAQR